MSAELLYKQFQLSPGDFTNWQIGPYTLYFHESFNPDHKIYELKSWGYTKGRKDYIENVRIPRSQAQLQARYEAGATFRTLRALKVDPKDYRSAKVLTNAVAKVAANKMKKWKQGKVPQNYSYIDYLTDVLNGVENYEYNL